MATPADMANKGRSQTQRIGDLTRERDRMAADLVSTKRLLGSIRDIAFSAPDSLAGFAEIRQVLGENWKTATPPGRCFDLVRYQDVSGVSGTGRVAEGYEFEDGTAVARWLGRDASTNVYASIDSMLRIHGHGGSTEVIWRDGDRTK